MTGWLDGLAITERPLVYGATGAVLVYLGLHLLLRRRGGAAARWLGLVLIAGAVNSIGLGAQEAVYVPYVSSAAVIVSQLCLLAVPVCAALFAYHFLDDDRARERRVATVLYLVLLAPPALRLFGDWIVGRPLYRPGFGGHYFDILESSWSRALASLPHGYTAIALIAAYTWTLVVLLRKCVRYERRARPTGAWRGIVRPLTRRGRATRDFAVLVVGLVLSQLAGPLGYATLTPVLILLISCACVWVHVSDTPDPTPLRFKLVSIPLAVVVGLQALAFAAFIADDMRRVDDALHEDARRVGALLRRARAGTAADAAAGGPSGALDPAHPAHAAADPAVVEAAWREIAALPRLAAHEVAPAVRFVVAHPAAAGPYPERYEPLFARDGFDPDVLARSDRNELAWRAGWTVWSAVRDDPAADPEAERRVALEALRAGTRGRWSGGTRSTFHGHLLDRADHYRVAAWEDDGVVVSVGWTEAHHRAEQGRLGLRLGLVIAATALILVLGLPVLFRASILRPLAALLDGVRRVDGGDLTGTVAVRTNDEIGVLAGSFDTMVGSVRTARETLERINAAAFRFVPRAFLKQLGHESILTVALGDQTRRTMTVLFADVRDFTSISERLTPDETFAFVNGLLRELGPVIRQRGGFIDKYLGDAIMALFDDADHALAAALEMRDALARLNADHAAAGRPPVRLGMGLHTGELMLGVVGEEERMDGTVLSDAVNTAARLQGLTKRFDADILTSAETVAALAEPGRFLLRPIERLQVKGRERHVELFEVAAWAADGAAARLPPAAGD